MTDRTDNILDLGPRLTARQQLTRDALLDATLTELAELGHQLRRLSPQPNWLPQRWGIESTAVRVRLASVRETLSAVTDQDSDDDRYPFRWTLQFDHLRFEVERRLDDIETCTHTLQRSDATPAQRAQKSATFTISKPQLLKVIGELQRLISELLLRHDVG